MAFKNRRLLTNFSKGELSPLVEGRPDLAAYFEGGRIIENWNLLRQGGVTRRPGTRFVAEVKDSTKNTILLPFETSVDDAYIVEVGNVYMRFFKNGQPIFILGAGPELVTNGGFATDIAGWTTFVIGAFGSVSWSAGQMRLQSGSGPVATVGARQQIGATTVGEGYTLLFTVTGAGLYVKVGTTAGSGDLFTSQFFNAGAQQVNFIAAGTVTWIEFSTHPDIPFAISQLDLVSVKVSSGLLELVSPYTDAQIQLLHFTQSVDVMWLFHPNVAQRELSRVSDTSWSISQAVFTPPPSFEADTDVSGGTSTLTPGATTGNGVTFTQSVAKLLAGDVGRLVIFGASRAVIKTLPSAGSLTFTADILDAFPDTNPIPAGSWFLRLPPQTTLDPDKKGPEGAQVTLVAAAASFRAADVGKFISIYGGLVRITIFDSTTQVRGEILSEMSATDLDNPAATSAWTLEVASWSVTNGFPRTGDFTQGRLGQASTFAQPTTFWLSRSNDFRNYAIGSLPDDAIDYTIASRQLNRIEWLTENIDLFLGTSGAELRVTSGGQDEALGGDKVPLVSTQSREGSTSVQPIVVGRRVVFVDRSRLKIFSEAFQIEEDGFDALELTAAAEQITGMGVRTGPIAYARRPDPRLYFVRDDGELITLTYYRNEKVIGFTRYVTEGQFQAVAVIPRVLGGPDQVWVIVQRTINGAVKRYVEFFEDTATDVSGRAWDDLQTDCAKVYDLTSATTVLTGLDHLEGKTVDVIADGSYVGTKVVTGGQITLTEAAEEHVEVGLNYDSTLVTMRPAVEGQMVEGLPRNWIKLWLRLKDTIGGKINGQELQYAPSPLDTKVPFTGDRDVTAYGDTDTVGYVTVEQTQPYPMTVLAVFGDIEFGDHS